MPEGVTLVEQAYAAIRQDILNGKLEPLQPLRIDRLKDEYSIGASPLREALSRLLTDGLVTNEGLRGFRVASASLADFRDITNVRKQLECYALKLSIEKGDEEWEGRLLVSHFHLTRSEGPGTARKSSEDMDRLRNSFHRALIDGCNSPHLLHFCMQLYDFSGRYRQISLRANPKRTECLDQEHTGIFRATMNRDVKRAIRLLGEHIEGTYQSVSRAFGDKFP